MLTASPELLVGEKIVCSSLRVGGGSKFLFLVFPRAGFKLVETVVCNPRDISLFLSLPHHHYRPFGFCHKLSTRRFGGRMRKAKDNLLCSWRDTEITTITLSINTPLADNWRREVKMFGEPVSWHQETLNSWQNSMTNANLIADIIKCSFFYFSKP